MKEKKKQIGYYTLKNPVKIFRNKESQFVLLNSVKKSGYFPPQHPLPGQKFEYIVISEEIQRWKAVKHSL